MRVLIATYAAAFVVMVASMSCTSVPSKYEVGQAWSYRNSRSNRSHVVILDVHKDARYGQVVFVAIDGLEVTTPDEYEIRKISSIPFSRAALDASLTALVHEMGVEISDQGELVGPAYKDWKRMNGDANTSTVSEFVESIPRSRAPNLRYDPPFPNSASPS